MKALIPKAAEMTVLLQFGNDLPYKARLVFEIEKGIHKAGRPKATAAQPAGPAPTTTTSYSPFTEVMSVS